MDVQTVITDFEDGVHRAVAGAEQGLLLPPYAKHLAEGPAAWIHQSLQGQWGLAYVLRQDGWSCISTCWWSPRRYGLAEGQYTTRRLRTCRLQELCKWELPDDGIPRWLHHHSFHLLYGMFLRPLSMTATERTTFVKGGPIRCSAWLAIILLLSGELSSGPSVKNPLYAPFFNRVQLTPPPPRPTRVRFASRGDSNPCARTVSMVQNQFLRFCTESDTTFALPSAYGLNYTKKFVYENNIVNKVWNCCE